VRIKTAEFGEQHPDLVSVLQTLAVACQWSGRNQDAFRASERAVSIVEGHFGTEANRLVEPLCNLSEAALSLGRYHHAYVAAERALAIQTKTGAECSPATAHAAAALGCVLRDIGELHHAQELLTRALGILSKMGDLPRQTAQMLLNLGIVDAQLGQYTLAGERLEQALCLFRGEAAPGPAGIVMANLAAVSSQLGDQARALALHEEALRMTRRRLGETSEDVGMSLLAIGKLQCSQGHSVGRDTLLRGMTILLNGDEPGYLAKGYRTLAEVLGREIRSVGIFFDKLSINVLQSLRQAVATLDAANTYAFLAAREDAYRSLGDRLILAGRLPEAQQVIAMIKEHELFQFTRGSIESRRAQASLTPFEDRWQQRIEDVRSKIKACCAPSPRDGRNVSKRRGPKQLREAVNRAAAELDGCLWQLCADFQHIEPPPDQPETEGQGTQPIIAARPAPGVALVHYLLAADELRIILTTSDLQRDYHVRLAPGEINGLVYAMRSGLQERSDHFLPTAQRLYAVLVGPFVRELTDRVHTLALSLDGVLRYLPLAALHDGVRYLVEDLALFIITGAAGPSSPPPASALRGAGLGTSRSIEGHPCLPGVVEELAAVIRTSDDDEGIVPGTIKIDEEFTAAALRESICSGNSVVHIASHFGFAVAQEAASFLQLGDGSRLTLAELSRMRFDGIELVTLSACDTAVVGGHHQSGREVEGLGALVRSRGARNVVASLWPVADLATVELMRAFYQNRYILGITLPEALRRAQVALLRGEVKPGQRANVRGLIDPDDEGPDGGHRTTIHPFYWAPYVLMADGSDPTTSLQAEH
jgi:CHAT domain-containing protein/tetratricopeptide (TPR) repeat protein